mmetsp:Transcript_93410/g.243275  ORF Transcript_93410/g.243275 Transcript_93410/m.243275 type:complete len:88 (-) Transcript_93410:962-1225(-)
MPHASEASSRGTRAQHARPAASRFQERASGDGAAVGPLHEEHEDRDRGMARNTGATPPSSSPEASWATSRVREEMATAVKLCTSESV